MTAEQRIATEQLHFHLHRTGTALGYVKFEDMRDGRVELLYVQTLVRKQGWMPMMVKYMIAMVMQRYPTGSRVVFSLEDMTDYLSDQMNEYMVRHDSWEMPPVFLFRSLYHQLGFQFKRANDVEMHLVLEKGRRVVWYVNAETGAKRPYFGGLRMLLRTRRMPRYFVMHTDHTGSTGQVPEGPHTRFRTVATRPTISL
jgi:hypothetical protein